MSDNIIIGLSGYAGSGKDLFYKLISNKINIKRYALADELKLDIRDQIKKTHDIDILTCSREEKDSIRHLLVEYGTTKREITNGRYWIDKLNEKISPIKEHVCITDVRYAHYEKDEAHWIKEELGGVLVWIDQYRVDVNEGARVMNTAPNEEEAVNGPKIRACADYVIEWEYLEDKSLLHHHVDGFLTWLNGREKYRRTAY
jgi:hypothetical protein